LRSLIGTLSDVDVKLLDHEQIERRLLESSKGRDVIQRFFPASFSHLKREPAQLYTQDQSICCDNCGKDLFNPPSGIWVIWHTDTEDNKEADHFVDMHFACKGTCDMKVEREVRMRHSARGFIHDGWDDIPDILVPTVFITKVMAFINGFARGDTYEPEVLEKVKGLLLTAFPHVSRNLTLEEQQTLEHLQRIPSYLGGMG
jgi:hypothetical protein